MWENATIVGKHAQAARLTGLRWREIGGKRPTKGVELTNAQLSEALLTKLEFVRTERDAFTQEEWDAFAITSLAKDHYIEAKGRYYVPIKAGEYDVKSWVAMNGIEQHKVLAPSSGGVAAALRMLCTGSNTGLSCTRVI